MGTWLKLAGGEPSPVGNILVSWRGRSLVPDGLSPHPTPSDTDDRLDRRGNLFLKWSFAAFEDGERRGSGDLQEDNSSSAGRSRYRSAQRPLCPCRDGKEEMSREALTIVRLGRLPIGFVGTRFLPATGLPARVVRPPTLPALLVLLPALGARGGTGLRRLSSLDC